MSLENPPYPLSVTPSEEWKLSLSPKNSRVYVQESPSKTHKNVRETGQNWEKSSTDAVSEYCTPDSPGGLEQRLHLVLL